MNLRRMNIEHVIVAYTFDECLPKFPAPESMFLQGWVMFTMWWIFLFALPFSLHI
jgi:hypothetical protein